MIKEIHFITGKGGVGKSLVAAGWALKEAEKGRKTLLVELGSRSFFKDFFNLSSVGYKPSSLQENLDLALWGGATALREYAGYLLRVETLAKLLFENPVSRSFIEIAPALPELAILGKITSGPREYGPPVPYDVLVVDAFSTGHFLSLLRAPAGMAEAIRLGPMGEQSREIQKVLSDQNLCRTHVVSLPEEMPVKETEELAETLRSEFKIQPDFLLNKWIDIPAQVSGENSFSEFLRETQARQKEMDQRFQKLGSKTTHVPLILADEPWDIVRGIAKALR